ncbi:MAG: hypothetical protein LW629_06335 [Burkholderiales bacterium]|jgi:hypothetical protein|nr:hypothetical protein [Burkholderiales bacterium]
MINPMSSYFAAEKQESLIFIVVGLTAIGISVWLWMSGHRLKSMAYPLVLIALLQLMVGGTIYLRTDTQLSALNTRLQVDPAALKAEETTRMQTVMKNFAIYKTVEMVLLFVGVAVIFFLQRHDMAAGIGVGLVLQAAFTLTLDIFAETRGAEYLSVIHSMPV